MPDQISTKVIDSTKLTRAPSRTNPAITKLGLFGDFAGGYLISGDIFFVPKDEACESHDNRGAVKRFVVMDGEGIIEVGNVSHRVKTNDSVLIPAGIIYRLIGTGDETPFKVFSSIIVAPGHEDDPQPWAPTTKNS